MQTNNSVLAQQANFVSFAYNMYEVDNLWPTPDPGIEAAGYKLVYYLHAKDLEITSFYGYLAVSKNNPADLVLAIRGTEDFCEWLLDFAAVPVYMDGIGFVALGFLSIFNSFLFAASSGDAPLNLIDVITKLSPVQSLNVVGHSLGAALSTLACVKLATTNPCNIKDNLTSITFASPRVGLLDFASQFNNTVKSSYRVWNSHDIVPELPVFPYIHVSGRGDEIMQTQAQLQQLSLNPLCEHHLNSYLWLLDPANFPLDSACRVGEIHSALSAAAGVSSDHSAGIEAMRKGAHGHL